jgi:hypothetical protein
VRTSEEIEAPSTEFDLDEARWTIPAERMKMDTPHIVPLSVKPWKYCGRSNCSQAMEDWYSLEPWTRRSP